MDGGYISNSGIVYANQVSATDPINLQKEDLQAILNNLYNAAAKIDQVANYATLPTNPNPNDIVLVQNTTTVATTIYPAGLYVYLSNSWKYIGLNIDNNNIVIANGLISLSTTPSVNQLTINNLPNIATDTATKGYVDSLTAAILQIPINYSIVNNVPAIADNTGTPGNTYAISDGGSRDFGSGSITTIAGDVLYIDKNKKVQKYPVSNSVKSVNGKTGIVTLAFGDLTNVVLTSLANNQIIAYQNSSGNFVNITLAPVALSGSYIDLSNKPALGTSAPLNVGTAANNVVQLDANAKLPGVNASQLTNITASQLSGLATVATTGSYADLLNKPTLATVATTGSYNDLINKPSIPQSFTNNTLTFTSSQTLDVSNIQTTIGLTLISLANGVVLTAPTGFKFLLKGAQTNTLTMNNGDTYYTTNNISTPTLITVNGYNGNFGNGAFLNAGTSPLNLVQLDSNAKFPALNASALTGLTSAQISGLSAVATSGSYTDLVNRPVFATVATSGSYTDLINKPTLGTSVQYNVGTAANNIVQLDSTDKLPALNASALTNISASQIAGLAAVATSGAYGDLTGKPILSTVATSGSYTDLINKPTLGTASAQNIGTSANNIVQLDANAKLPAVDGSAVINITASQITGLGTAASKNVGTAAGNVVQLDTNTKLPAVDGSQLINLPTSYATDVVTLTTSSTLSIADIASTLALTAIVTADNITTTAPNNYTFNYKGTSSTTILMNTNEIYYFTMNSANSTIIYITSYSKPHSRTPLTISSNTSFTAAQLPIGYFIEFIFTGNYTITIASGVTFSPISSSLATNSSGVTAQTIVGNNGDVYMVRADGATPTVYNILSNTNILNYSVPTLATNTSAIAAGDTIQTIVNKTSTALAALPTSYYSNSVMTITASTTLTTTNINANLALTAIITTDNIVLTPPSGYSFDFRGTTSSTLRVYSNEVYYLTMQGTTIYVSADSLPTSRTPLTISANTTYNSFQIPAGYLIEFIFTGSYTVNIPSGISFSPVSNSLATNGSGVTAQSIVGNNGDVYVVRADITNLTVYNILAYNNVLTYAIPTITPSNVALANGDIINVAFNKLQGQINARSVPTLANIMSIRQNAAQTLSAGNNVINFDTLLEYQQPSGAVSMWSTNNPSLIYIRVAGWYDIRAAVRVNASLAGDERYINIQYNGNQYTGDGGQYDAGEITLTATLIKLCAVGDTFAVGYFDSQSGTETVTTGIGLGMPNFTVAQRATYVV